jgi:hypothetical protein
MTTAIDELLLATADVEIQASGKQPSVNIVAYTGGLMSVPGWGPVAIELSGIDASADQVSILADHDSRLSGIIGHGKAIVATGKLLVQGTITPSTEASRQVIELASGGFRFQASVGLSPTNYERVRPNETVEVNGRAIKAPASGFTLVKAGVLREVSIVAIGADANTSVTIAATNAKENIMFISETIVKMLGIDRRDIINDDLSMFDETSRLLGRAAMRSLSDLVYKTLLANTGSFFSGGNSNYDAGVGTALSITSLEAGIARMMAQRDTEKRDLDIRAKTLLVPPELQVSAKQLLMSEFIKRASNDVPTGNALKNSVGLEVEPRLSNSDRFTGTSAKAWYLFASPSDTPIIVAFLQGKQMPTVEFFGLDSDVNRLAVSWRVYFDYGAALADHRAAYKAKGEA